MIAVEGADQLGGIEDNLRASAVSPVESKAADRGRMGSERASRSAAICDRGVAGVEVMEFLGFRLTRLLGILVTGVCRV